MSTICEISLHRPDASMMLDETSLTELETELEQALQAPEVAAVVLRGSREAFLNGMNPEFFRTCFAVDDIDRLLAFGRRAQAWQRRIEQAHKPVVAWVEGSAYGAGVEIALACQMILAGPHAKFCLPETRLGIYPGMGGTQRLPRRVGLGLGKWMIFSGAIVPAAVAGEIGLVDRLTDLTRITYDEITQLERRPLALSERHQRLAEFFSQHRLAELRDPAFPQPTEPELIRTLAQVRANGPLGQRLAEEAIDRGYPLPLADGLEEEFCRLREVFQSEDARIGMQQGLSGRPAFVGR